MNVHFPPDPPVLLLMSAGPGGDTAVASTQPGWGFAGYGWLPGVMGSWQALPRGPSWAFTGMSGCHSYWSLALFWPHSAGLLLLNLALHSCLWVFNIHLRKETAENKSGPFTQEALTLVETAAQEQVRRRLGCLTKQLHKDTEGRQHPPLTLWFWFPRFQLWCSHNILAWASLVAQTVKNLPAMQETGVLPLGGEDP